jgi:NarL family two-component system response regulator LiaR
MLDSLPSESPSTFEGPPVEDVNGQEAIRVCVVAENCLARSYLMELLRKDPGMRPVALDELLASRWPLSPPKVFVVDRCGLTIPLFECFRRLRCRNPDARFLVLGNQNDKEEVVRLLILGAHGFLEQGRAPQLLRAIHFVARGQLWVSPDILEAYLKEVGTVLHDTQQRRGAFTPREMQVLEMVRCRMSNREIAGLLKISVSTVKFHLTNILSKRQAGGRRDLLTPPQSEIWNKLSQ